MYDYIQSSPSFSEKNKLFPSGTQKEMEKQVSHLPYRLGHD